MKEKITVAEIFGPTLQGEGVLVGRPTVFVRTGGCDFRCSWCDSLHAVLPAYRSKWQQMCATRIMVEVAVLTNEQPILITLSGGNPALQPLGELLDLGHQMGYTFALETQGSVAKPWFHKLDHLILSPKPPSSGMPFRRERLEECLEIAGVSAAVRGLNTTFPPVTSLKVVVLTEDDYTFALMIYDEFAEPAGLPFYITPGNHKPPSQLINGQEVQGDGEIDLEGITRRTEWLIERVKRDGWNDLTIVPQLQTFLWGNARGV